MPKMTLVRQDKQALSEEERVLAMLAFCSVVDGLGQENQRKWRRFLRSLMRLEPGEMMDVETNQERLGPYHRKHMKMEHDLYRQQERFTDFKRGFRDWLKVGAGHCDWHPGPKGGVFPVPKSTSYAEMEQGEMEEFHYKVVDFLRTEHAQKTLWPHASVIERMEFMEGFLAGFERGNMHPSLRPESSEPPIDV